MRSIAEAVVHEVLATVDYLRADVGSLEEEGLISCRRLLDDPEFLFGIVRSTASDRGTDRDDVAMSLFVQGYSYRVASMAIGAWLLNGTVLDVSPENMAIRMGRARPNGVRFASYSTIDGPPTLDRLHETLVERHLARLFESARQAIRVGERLLWANVGASCASLFGAFLLAAPERSVANWEAVTAFFEAARPELARSGRVVPLGPVWAWERQSCCLWYKTENGFKCQDCSLWTDEERQERYDRVLAEVVREVHRYRAVSNMSGF